MFRKMPLIVILGSTGTGKTRLSIQLAQRFGGEIISADSMQIYANLDIATAKATKCEQSSVKHHLLDIARPSEPFTVFHFRNAALPIIENLLNQSKCPIIVGGTNYYIESLLWDILIDSSKQVTTATSNADIETTSLSTEDIKQHQPLTEAEMSAMASNILHDHLRKIDPITAHRIHPNNKRKIVRAIEVYQLTGQKLSKVLDDQRKKPGGNRLGGPLRYPHTILFWLRCNQEILNDRLDKRVDSMLEQGLLQEIRNFYDEHLRDICSNEYTKGILQTIGFKEFIPYLEKFDAVNDEAVEEYLKANSFTLPELANSSSSNSTGISGRDDIPQGLDVLQSCLNELKLVTRRYSKKQIKWINNRLLASKDRQVPDLYELDSSDITKWNDDVFMKAVRIVDCYSNGQVSDNKPMEKTRHPCDGLDEETSNFCETCERHFVGDFQWQEHMNSNKHKRRKAGLQKIERLKLKKLI